MNMHPLALGSGRVAILPLDLQTGVVAAYVKDDAFVPRIARLLAAARTVHAPILYVKVAFRVGVPEASDRHPLLRAIKTSEPHQRLFQGSSGAIHASLAPEEKDPVVVKSRVSAFAGTDLDLLLRARDIDTIVLCGIATSGAVLSTALHGADLDYRVIVVADCCADGDADLHACIVDKILPRCGQVAVAADISRALGIGPT